MNNENSDINFYEYNIYLKLQEKKELNLKELSIGLNRFVIKLLSKGNKSLINDIKLKDDIKPFRITFLQETERELIYKFKLYFISKALLNNAFIKGVNTYNNEIDLNYNKFSLIGYEKIREANLDNIFEKSIQNLEFNKIKFHFLSETTFKKNILYEEETLGEYPFPDINKIFSSLLNKWNKLIPNFQLDEKYLLSEISKNIHYVGGNIIIKRINLGYSEKSKVNISCFLGDLLAFIKTKDIQFKKNISLLLIFSEWSGIGKKNCFGMGNVMVDFL